MKNLTVNRLALGNLKARKKQYILMITGIILAIAFSSGSIFFYVCSKATKQEASWAYIGKQDMIITKCDDFDLDGMKQQGFIDDYSTADIISFAYSPEKNFESGMGIAVYNDKSRDMAYFRFLEGSYPENEGEIAIESDALYRLGLMNAQIGDEITLITKPENGDEILDKEITKTYKLTGIIRDRRSAYESWFFHTSDKSKTLYYPAAVVCDSEKTDLGGRARQIAYIKNENVPKEKRGTFFEKYTEYLGQTGTITASGDLDKTDGFIIQTYGLFSFDDNKMIEVGSNVQIGTILAVILSVASCLGIINAFNSNLQERKKQIGMLRAIGATRRQIIKIFGREAVVLALICVPVGVSVAYGAVALFAKFMGEPCTFSPEFYIPLAAAVVSFAFVMLSAMLPLLNAARVSPMQAIRNIELTRKMRKKKIKGQKVFDPAKLISKRSMELHRFRQVSIGVILAVMILVTCIFSSLMKREQIRAENSFKSDYTMYSNLSTFSMPYNVNGINKSNALISEADIQDILSNRYVKSVEPQRYMRVNFLLEDDWRDYDKTFFCYSDDYDKPQRWMNMTNEEFAEYYKNAEKNEMHKRAVEALDYGGDYSSSRLKTYSEEKLKSLEIYLIDGKINIDKINSGEEIVIVAPEKHGVMVNIYKNHVRSFNNYQINNGIKYYMDDNIMFSNKKTIDLQKIPFKAGDEITLSMLIKRDVEPIENNDFTEKDIEGFERYDKNFKIGAIVYCDRPNSDYFFSDDLCFLTTNDGFDAFGCTNIGYDAASIDLNESPTDEVDEEMMGFFRSFRSNPTIYSTLRDSKYSDADTKTFMVTVTSIVILMMCVAAALINNSLASKIRENKREFGTLRALGASVKELTKAYDRQLLSIFGVGCGLGFGAFTLLYVVGRIILRFRYLEPITAWLNHYEIWQAALICVVLFLVCAVNLRARIKKQAEYSIVENIREL